MTAVVADTHAIVWYLAEDRRLSPAAKAGMDGALAAGEHIYLSGITCIEIAYLVERGRLSPTLLDRLREWLRATDSGLVEVAVDSGLIPYLRSIPRELVPEMPDRIIAGTALLLRVPLVTGDLEIRRSSVPVIW